MAAPLKQQKVKQTSVCPLDLADETPELVACQERTQPMEGGSVGLCKGGGEGCGASWPAWVLRFATLDALQSKTVTALDVRRDSEPADQRVRVNDALDLKRESFMTTEGHLEIALALVKASFAPTNQPPTSSGTRRPPFS